METKGSDVMLTRKELSAFFEKTVLLDGATGSNLQKAGMPRLFDLLNYFEIVAF